MTDRTDTIWRERALRDAVRAGDEAAWRALYDESYDGLYAFVRLRLSREPAAVDEIVQECWMVAVRSIARFEPERSTFQTWLLGIARNLVRNYHRKASRRREEALADSDLDESAVGGAKGADAGQAEQRRRRVGLALASLSAAYRSVLRAKYGEQRSVAAIAA